jgi:FMN phosphatase YigB (HAD superfamily)
MPIEGLIFDAYGTLYDVQSVQAKTEEHANLAAQAA